MKIDPIIEKSIVIDINKTNFVKTVFMKNKTYSLDFLKLKEIYC